MSLPPLPSGFGNQVLGDIEHIIGPPPVDWYPPAPGWFALAVILLAFLLHYCGRRLKRWGRNRYRRDAVRMLGQLHASEADPASVAAINRILKLVVLAAWPRQQVAALSGPGWAAFLDTHCTCRPFDRAQLCLLTETVYAAPLPDPAELQRLLQAASLWIRHHQGPADA